MVSLETNFIDVSGYQSLDQDSKILDPSCNGCNLIIEEGSVVAFGGYIWHVNCFRCMKCNAQVNHDSSLFFLYDRNPICEKCSCSSSISNKHSDDFAITTESESYHSEYFQCNICGKKIEEFVFAKTNQRIYCISCYNNKVTQNKKNERDIELSVPSLSFNKSLPSIPSTSTLSRLNSQTSMGSEVTVNDKPVEKPYIDLFLNIEQTELLNFNKVFSEFKNKEELNPKRNSKRHSFIWPPFAPLDFFLDISQTSINLETKHIPNTDEIKNNTTTISSDTSLSLSNHRSSIELPNFQESLKTKSVQEIAKHTDEEHIKGILKEFSKTKKYDKNISIKEEDIEEQKLISQKKKSISGTSLTENNRNHYSTSIGDVFQNTQSDSKQDMPSDFSFKSDFLHDLDIRIQTQNINSNSSSITNETNKFEDFSFESYNKNNPKNQDFVTLPKQDRNYDNQSETPSNHSNVTSTSPFSSNLESSKSFIKHSVLEETNINPLTFEISNISSKDSNAIYSKFHSFQKNTYDYQNNYVKDQNTQKHHFNQSYSKILNAIRHRRSASESKKKTSKYNIFSKSRVHEFQQLSPYINLNNLNETLNNYEDGSQETINLSQLKESKVKVINNESIMLDRDILKKKALLAELDAKCEITLRELKIFENEQLINQNRVLSRDDIFNGSIVSKLLISLTSLKNKFQSDIETLILQRNALYKKNTELLNIKNKITQEIHQLSFKKSELKDLNDKLTQKIQEQFRAHKNSTYISPQADIVFDNQNTKPLPPIITSVPKSNNDNFDLISPTESVSTPISEKTKLEYTESSDDNSSSKAHDKNDTRVLGSKISSWKKNSSLARNLVKGFNKIRSSESDTHNGCKDANLSTNLTNLTLKKSLSNNLRHTFSTYTFLRITRCDYCGNKLWGNEMRCLGCGIPCHIKCIGDITTNCNRSMEYLPYHENVSLYVSSSVNLHVPTLFGNDLTKQVQAENRNIPFIVTKCIDEVEKRGIFFEGIYRKSGSASQMRILIDAFNNNNIDNLSQSVFEDISVVTSVLKQYFRKLPNPLITYEIYIPFLEIIASDKTSKEKLISVKNVLNILPKAHYDCLEFLISHLCRIIEHSDKNLMPSKNLAVVFSPTLLRDEKGTRDIVDIQVKNIGIQYLLDNSKNIFQNS
ncbi:hypothetical protein PNEG_02631 [Pneumocystis murina B123]|uniref:RhoGAP-domain-containing protein n=1 Tax=Pneumocystis murina (strain B123) TaxID=1069680 RepID=M7PEF7_PNEMU|nr:hypothetical protein PNEG_02631 [Pneumocystis murina B123]EMR08844.1 hypothetical protein PNEG_02631 [Pneumocystis murina B123]